jgi:putative ABC transport system permease protein
MSLLQDLRYGARLILRKPAVAAICILTLSVGIGLTGMMFSLVNGAIFKGLPFEQADRIMSVVHADATQGFDNMSIQLHDLEAYRAQQDAFESLGTYTTGTFNVSGPEGAERYDGGWMSADVFQALRVSPILGRTFRPGEDAPGAQAVAVIGYRMWQDRFGGDPQVLGQTLRINGEAATIVGVMGEGFMFPERQAVWLPERRNASLYERGAPDVPSLGVIGRLKPGVSADQASVQFHAISQRLADSHPETNEDLRASVLPFTERYIGSEPRTLLFVMLGAVFGVLLIACVNVANLLLAQAALRAREVGIRTALGASRLRLIAQFLTEPLLLATVGAILGLGIAWIGVRIFTSAVAGTNPPFWLDFGIDATVLLFVLGVALFATLVSGVLPAIRASGGNVSEILKDESRGASSLRGGRLTKALVIAEVALSVVLLAGAGLMIKTVANVAAVDFAFATDDVFTARLGVPEADQRYAEPAERIRFFEEVEARVAAEPGIRAAALASSLPGVGSSRPRLSVDGEAYARPADQPFTRAAVVTSGFFEAVGSGIAEGRGFGPQDRAGSLPVAIVNQSFAATHFPGGDAIGRRVRLGGPDTEAPWLTIVGIAPDLHMSGVQNEEPEGLYTPLAQAENPRFMSIVARTAGPPLAVAPQVRRAVAAADADIPIYWVQSLAESIREQTWFFRVFGSIFMIMGIVALFLAAIGLYGVMSFSVSRRTREMGVRMALGARADHVVRLIMRQGVVQLAAGLVLGLIGALGVTSLLTGFLFGVGPRDPATFAAIVAVLVVTGLLASWVPARRATRVDPLVAIRYE